MGMIGRYINSLTDEQRDRVIEHPDPTYSGGAWHNGTCGCLVGAAQDAPAEFYKTYGNGDLNLWCPAPAGVEWLGGIGLVASEVGSRFPELTYRFGAPRIWAAVKARAARGNRIPTAPPARETVGAA